MKTEEYSLTVLYDINVILNVKVILSYCSLVISAGLIQDEENINVSI